MAFLAGYGWLVRLEGRAQGNSKSIVDLEQSRQEDREADREMLREIRGDIKTLMMRGPE